jgi:hypothetical protein
MIFSPVLGPVHRRAGQGRAGRQGRQGRAGQGRPVRATTMSGEVHDKGGGGWWVVVWICRYHR